MLVKRLLVAQQRNPSENSQSKQGVHWGCICFECVGSQLQAQVDLGTYSHLGMSQACLLLGWLRPHWEFPCVAPIALRLGHLCIEYQQQRGQGCLCLGHPGGVSEHSRRRWSRYGQPGSHFLSHSSSAVAHVDLDMDRGSKGMLSRVTCRVTCAWLCLPRGLHSCTCFSPKECHCVCPSSL